MPENPVPIKPQKYVATTTLKKNLATKFYYFEFETQEPFEFVAGQYVSSAVAEHTFRAYSIASKTGVNSFGLLVDTRPGGPGSQFFESIQVGDKMEFLGPSGIFIIHEDDSENILLLGTGSGISPLKCIVEDELFIKETKKPLYLYFGLTKYEELFWVDYFTQLDGQFESFYFRMALFEEHPSWDGHVGYNTDLMKQDFPDSSSCSAYLCGHPAMIEGATKILVETGCNEKRIYKEKFFRQK